MLIIIATLLGLAASTVHGLTLDVTPATVEIGVTRNLQVKCSTSLTTGSAMSSLISLIISRGHTNNSTFTEIAAINVFESTIPVVYDHKENVTATGKIDNNGVSYMTLVWDFPDQNKAGVYRCEANGVDRGGHPVSVTTGQTVTVISPSVDVLVKQVQVLTSYIEQVHSMVEVLQNYNLNNRINQMDVILHTLRNQNLSNRIDQVDSHVENLLGQNLSSRIQQVQDNVHTLLNQNLNNRIYQLNVSVNNLEINRNASISRFEASKSSFFRVSSVLADNGHRYLLSNRLYTVEINQAEANCVQYGGYLVAIDNEAELQFIRHFMSNHSEIVYVLTGGKDIVEKGKWVSRHNGTPMTYFNWGIGEPDSGTKGNCIYLWTYGDLLMGDDPCYKKRDTFDLSFMCELEV